MSVYDRFVVVISKRLIELVGILKDRYKDRLRSEMVFTLVKENYWYLVYLDKKRMADNIISDLEDKI